MQKMSEKEVNELLNKLRDLSNDTEVDMFSVASLNAYFEESADAIQALFEEIQQYKPMTQADRIRTMSNEELAMTMMCPNDNGLAEIECDKSDSCNCYECLLEWLQSEVEEESENKADL